MPFLLILLFALLPVALSAGDSVTALQTQGTVYIRSSFSHQHDVVTQIGEGANGQITFLRTGLIPVAAPMTGETCQRMFVFHVTPDESAPWKVNGTYIGGGHGWSGGVLELEEADHGLQQSDLGSLWKDSESRPYRLISIPGPDRLWLMPENRGSLVRWNFDHRYRPPFHHPEGRTLSGSQLKRVQLSPSLRSVRKTFLIDGRTPLQEGKPATGSYLEVTDQHDIINPAGVIEAVLANPGEPTSFIGPDLPALFSNTITYRFEDHGHCHLQQTSTVHTDLTLDYIGILQSTPLVRREGDTLRTYIPGTLPFEAGGQPFDFQALQDASQPPPEPLHFSTAQGNLADAANPPHRIVQLLESRLTPEPVIGYAIGYSLLSGLTTPDQRAANCNQAAFIHTSAKLYPVALDARFGPLYAGTTLHFSAYRRYFTPQGYSNHATSFYWHREGSTTTLYVDYHQPVTRDTLKLPAFLAGARLEVLEATPGVKLHAGPTLDRNGLPLSVEADYGRLVLKLESPSR